MSNYTHYYQQPAAHPAQPQQYVSYGQPPQAMYNQHPHQHRPLPPPTPGIRQRPESMPPSSVIISIPSTSSPTRSVVNYPGFAPPARSQPGPPSVGPPVSRRPLPTPTPAPDVRIPQQSQSVDLGYRRTQSPVKRPLPLPSSPPQPAPVARHPNPSRTVPQIAARFERDRAYSVSDANSVFGAPGMRQNGSLPGPSRWDGMHNHLPPQAAPPQAPLPRTPAIPSGFSAGVVRPPTNQTHSGHASYTPSQQYAPAQSTPPSSFPGVHQASVSLTRSATRVAPLPTPPSVQSASTRPPLAHSATIEHGGAFVHARGYPNASTDVNTSSGRRALPPSPTLPPDLRVLHATASGSQAQARPASSPLIQRVPTAPQVDDSTNLEGDSSFDSSISSSSFQSIDDGSSSIHTGPSPNYGIRELPKKLERVAEIPTRSPSVSSIASPTYGIRDLPVNNSAVPAKPLPNRGPRSSANRHSVVGESRQPYQAISPNTSPSKTKSNDFYQQFDSSSPALRYAAMSLKNEQKRYSNGLDLSLDDAPPPPASPVLRRSPSPSPRTWSSPPKAPQASHPASIPSISLPDDDDDDDDDYNYNRPKSSGPSISISLSSPQINSRASTSSAPSIVVNGGDKHTSAPPAISTQSTRILPPVPGPTGQFNASIPSIRPGGMSCGACSRPIAGRIVSAMGQRWHPECFKCCTCGEGLEHVSAYEHEGRPYCHLCYHETFAPRCYHCKTTIVDERFITLDDPGLGKRSYHESHFFCAECGDPFLPPSRKGGNITVNGDGAYMPDDEEDDVGFTVFKGHPYCEACHVRLRMPKCKKCKRSIRHGMQAVEALGGKWCWECFVCASCEKPFEDPAFFQRDNKPYCEPCFSLILRNEI